MLGIVADRFTNMWSYLSGCQCYMRVGRAADDSKPEDAPEVFKDVNGSGVSLDVHLCDKVKNVYVNKWDYEIEFLTLEGKSCVTYTQRLVDKRTWRGYTIDPVILLLDEIQVDVEHVEIKGRNDTGSYCLHFDICLFLELLGISRYVLTKSNADVKSVVVRRLSYILSKEKLK